MATAYVFLFHQMLFQNHAGPVSVLRFGYQKKTS